MKHFVKIVYVLCALQVAVALVRPPGTFIIDEVTYHAMTRSLVTRGSLAIDNGIELTSSPELEWEHARQVGSQIVPQYPPGFPFVVAPFYRWFGLRGFTIVTTLAFYATILVTRALALRVLEKRALADVAAMVFAFGTYAWEYSFALWPHTLTLLLTTGAFLLAHRGAAFTAGMLVGLATTMRLDAIFMLPALLILPALLAPRRSLARAGLTLAGTVPALALLAVANHVKFGTWQPLSYGPWHAAGSNTDLSAYAPLAVGGAIALVAIHSVRLKRVHVLAGIVLTVAAVALVRPAMFDRAWMLLVDLRHSDPNDVQPGLSHSPRGAMMYVGALKKSFLQSLPWIPFAAIAPFLERRLVPLAVPVILHCGVFGALGWHGGLCLNLRYLLPAVPFLAILATYGGYRLLRRSPRWNLREVDAKVLMIAAAWLAIVVVAILPSSLTVQELFFLDGALVLAAIGVVAIATRWRFAVAVLVVAVVWAGLTELSYDAVATVRHRAHHARIAARVRALVPPGSVVFAEYPDLVSDVIEDDDIIAEPRRDGHRDVARIVGIAATKGKASFAVLAPATFTRLREQFDTDALKTEELGSIEGFSIHRLSP